MINQKEKKEKALRALYRERESLEKTNRELGLMKLDEPYQRGWMRFYVLTERSRQRLDCSTLEQILPYLNSTVICKRSDFTHRRGKSKKMVEIMQPLRSICRWRWAQEKLPLEWLRYFRWERNGWQRAFEFVFVHPWYYELTVVPNWITHTKMIDPEIESRLGEIENRFTNYQLWPRYRRLKGKSANWWWYCDTRKQKTLSREAAKEIRAFLTGEVTVEAFSILLRRLQPYLSLWFLERQPDQRAGCVC